MIQVLRNGTWATAARLRGYQITVLATLVLALILLVATSDGMRDAVGRPLGTDFSQVWTAGRQVLAGRPEAPFDPTIHAAAQRAAFGAATPFYGWHYPPYFLVLAAALALLPYTVALLLWQGWSFCLYLGSIWGITRAARTTGRLNQADILLAACAFPAVFVNVTHGHNGFLTAALLAFGLLACEKRPLLAGFCFGLLAYKPQFALVLPVALVACGRWRTILTGVVTVASMTVATLAAFGPATWEAFFKSLAFTRTVVLEQGDTGWEKIQSPFAAVRMMGAGIDAAYAVQGVVTVVVLLMVAFVWRSRTDDRIKAALLMTASLLTTPYCLDYDLMVLGPALAFAFALSVSLDQGFRPWDKTVFAAVWLVPAFARVVGGIAHLPLGLIVMLLFFGLLIRRARASGHSPHIESAGIPNRAIKVTG